MLAIRRLHDPEPIGVSLPKRETPISLRWRRQSIAPDPPANSDRRIIQLQDQPDEGVANCPTLDKEQGDFPL